MDLIRNNIKINLYDISALRNLLFVLFEECKLDLFHLSLSYLV